MPKPADDPDVTQLLAEWRHGDDGALARLIPIVYQELRRVARAHLRNEGSDHTLETTALVHEAYLRLVGLNRMTLENRTHFFANRNSTTRDSRSSSAPRSVSASSSAMTSTSPASAVIG